MNNASKIDLSRRSFLASSASVAAVLAVSGQAGLAQAATPHQLPDLPFANDALEPIISAQTISFHYGRHHRGYLDNLNRQLQGSPLASLSLVDLIKATAGRPEYSAIFNNAAQVWNHTFYWQSLKPNGGGEPPERLATMMSASFGSVQACKQALMKAANRQFASGWAWLVQDGARLRVVSTSNAELPLSEGLNPLLTIDVWEHAYYLDHQNKRAAYTEAVVERLLNWQFANDNVVT
jgi:superoxide dismutase, Fe-Mn family